MQQDKIERRSRWVMRVMEWDDQRARYPNIWHAGMPKHLMVFDRVAARVRLGDLLAVYYPASQRHKARADRFLGLSRIAGLRRADAAGYAWIDLETAHRFASPKKLGAAPRRVFLCCDPGWPEPEVDLFRRVFDAAVAEGWRPKPEETEGADSPTSVAIASIPSTVEETTVSNDEPAAEQESTTEQEPAAQQESPTEQETPAQQEPTTEQEPVAEQEPATPIEVETPARAFAGAAFDGDMRDPREGTWLATVELIADRLRVTRLEATGRSGLQAYLRDPDSRLMTVEAIGLGFPFGLPVPFAEKLIGGSFPEEGWWALVRRLERISRPDYLSAGQEFCAASGEATRLTDEIAGARSPLHRDRPDLSPMAYHGIRMIGQDRSRYAIRPFETAQGKLLLEVRPDTAFQRLGGSPGAKKSRNLKAAIETLATIGHLPVDLSQPHRGDRNRTCNPRFWRPVLCQLS